MQKFHKLQQFGLKNEKNIYFFLTPKDPKRKEITPSHLLKSKSDLCDNDLHMHHDLKKNDFLTKHKNRKKFNSENSTQVTRRAFSPSSKE